MGLKHYLAEMQTADTLLAAIIAEPFGMLKLLSLKYTVVPPMELVHVFAKGLAKDPAKRFQSAAELIGVLHRILEGQVAVQCHISFTKRVFREMGRLVDRAPWLGFATLIGVVALVVFALVQLVRIGLA
jgi:serine/threonine-protein kinase